MLNIDKLCPCHFHRHAKGGAYEDHEKCTIQCLSCGHGDGNEDETSLDIAEFLGQNMGNLGLDKAEDLKTGYAVYRFMMDGFIVTKTWHLP